MRLLPLIIFVALVCPASHAITFGDCVEGIISVFEKFRGVPSMDDYKWPNGKISEPQWKLLVRIMRRSNKMPAKGTAIELIPVTYFKEGEVIPLYGAMQTVRKNGEYENDLLKKSNVDTAPREVLHVRLHRKNGTIVNTDIELSGTGTWIPFDKVTQLTIEFLSRDLENIETIEITHTHPFYAVRIYLGDGAAILDTELSSGDLDVAARMAARLPATQRVLIRAVCPTGFNWSASYQGGQR